MAGDVTTIARPYAEAIFKRAVESDKLELWSDMLEMLATAMQDQALRGLVANPKLTSAEKAELMLDIGGGHINDEGQNFIKLLTVNDRLSILPEVAQLYKARRAEQEGTVDVEITTAYELKPAQEKVLSDALQAKLGRAVNIHNQQDASLIGGFKLRAGDMVIDGSVSGQLNQLAHELGI